MILRRALYEFRLRRRFPASVIHSGATADTSCVLGKHTVLFRNVRLIDSSLGAFSYVQENSALYGVEVGPFCSIAGGVAIGLINHPTSMVSTSPIFYDNTQPLPHFFAGGNQYPQNLPRTLIGADVWVGDGAKIMAGVCVGVGAVIGAGAIVTRDVLPYTIAVGIPCRRLRTRFDEALCNRLLESRWWTLSEERLTALALHFSDPEAFLNALGEGQ